MEVAGKRSRGIPKRRWLDAGKHQERLSERELSEEDAQDRAKWFSVCRGEAGLLVTPRYG